MKILLVGGGSMGSVSPLLAVQKYMQLNCLDRKSEFFWLTSKRGPEVKFFDEYNQDKAAQDRIRYKKIISARFKRRISLIIVWQLIRLGLALWQSLFFLLKTRPDIILSAGSYVSPPVIWAGWLLRIPVLIHQQDVRPGLANKMMAPFAKRITVCFESSQRYFGYHKTCVVGNPVRQEIKEASQLSEQERKVKIKKAKRFFELEDDLPVVMVVSGSQGAVIINEVTNQALPELLKFCQVIHVTGRRQIKSVVQIADRRLYSRYHKFEFLTSEIVDALLVADLVISRAGMNFLTEYAYLKKAALLIPVFNSHQEDNAKYCAEKKAAQILSLQDRENDTRKQVKIFIDLVRRLIGSHALLEEMKNNISSLVSQNAEQAIADLVIQVNTDPKCDSSRCSC